MVAAGRDKLKAFFYTSVFVLIAACSTLLGIDTTDPAFCTLDDVVFQTISADVEDWVKEFRSPARRNSTGSRSLLFQIPDGRYLTARALWDTWSDTDAPIIYVMLERNVNEAFGRYGYVYSPDRIYEPDLVPSYSKHKFEYLDDDIYC